MHPASKKRCDYGFLLLTGTVLTSAITLTMQASAQNTSPKAPKVERAEIKYVSPSSGKEMYDSYCAVCHGANARGNGPAAPTLRKQPTDLTMLSARNGGKFPILEARFLLTDIDATHETSEMPHWGPALKSLDVRHPDLLTLRAYNLLAYLQTVQAPAVSAGSDPR